MASGMDPNARKREAKTRAVTLRQAFQAFKDVRKGLKPRTLIEYDRVLSTLFKDWLDKPWTSITGDMVLRRHGEIGQQRGAALANLSARVLRAVINFARAKYRDGIGQPLILENPVSRIGHTKAWYKVDRRTNYIKPHQFPAWFEAVMSLENETVRDYLIFVLFTGLRRNEAEMLDWQDVDFDDRSFIVRDPKNRRPLTLPLSDFLVDLLIARRKDTNNHCVFAARSAGGHLVESRKQRAKVIEASGVKFTVHDLRRTFATIAESLDIPAYALKALLNHKTNASDVTGGYIQMSVERLRKPAQQITDYILSAACVKPKGQLTVIDAARKRRAN
jgi:integrase